MDADGEYSDGGYPQGEHSLWSMDLGEEYLDNGGPGYIYTLNAYNPKDPAQVVEDFENDSLISIVNDTVFNDTRMIFYTEGGICGFYNVFIFGDNYSIKLKSVCGADSQERTGMTEDIARTFRFIDQDVVIDCGSVVTQEDSWDNPSNYDCFIAASQDCQLAELSSTMSIIFGMAITATTNMQLKGLESDKCAYVQEVESYNVEFTDEYVQEMLDGGSTQEEIDQAEQEANDSAQDLVGVELTCKFEQDDLTAMLSRWKTGEFHGGTSCQLNFDGGEHDCEYTGDFEGAQCEYNWE